MSKRDRARAAREARQQVIIAGDGIVATEVGHKFEAVPSRELPVKIPGQHRWIATVTYVLDDLTVETAADPDVMKYLDHENLHYLGIGCWDCEEVLGSIEVGSVCPGDPSEASRATE